MTTGRTLQQMTIEELEAAHAAAERAIKGGLDLQASIASEITTKRARKVLHALDSTEHDPERLARTFTAVEQRYEKAMRKEFNTYDPMDDDEFWVTIASLRVKVATTRDLLFRFKNTLEYFFWSYLHNDGWKKEAWADLVAFMEKYKKVEADLHAALFDVPGVDKGDDGYGDLCGNLPLLGKTFYDRAMAEKVHHADDIKKPIYELAARFEVGPQQKDDWFDFIWHGENYVTMKMEKYLMDKFPSVLPRKDDD